jgi:Protein of unknown function (DUF3987)/Bifunctional DNA primase/polymerase, N-terminal
MPLVGQAIDQEIVQDVLAYIQVENVDPINYVLTNYNALKSDEAAEYVGQARLLLPHPDANGYFASPADGAKFMAGNYQIPQTPLRGKGPFKEDWQDKATLNFDQIDLWASEYPGCNFGSVAKATRHGRFVLEVDSVDVRKRAELSGVKFSSQLIIESRPGRGHRWYVQSNESIALGNVKQDASPQGDFSVRVHNQQGVSPGSINPVSGVQYRVISAGEIAAPTSAEIAWLKSQVKPKEPSRSTSSSTEKILIKHGNIHNYMLTLAGRLRRAGMTAEEIEPVLLRKVHEDCEPPIDDAKVIQMAHSIEKYEAGNPAAEIFLFTTSPRVVNEKLMPDPISQDAYYGLAGRHLRNIEANSEAHPAGILGLFLSAFGSIIGTSAYMRVEDNLHYPMVNVIVTGRSSRSRKDTSMGRALRPLKAADPIWGNSRIKQGFSSGEAVVAYFEKLHRANMPPRLFVTDTEFKTTLTICGREGNTLSEMFRHMFNGDPMEVNVKNSKETISVPRSCGTSAGLITRTELLDVLKESEKASGFVNRYMMLLVHRVRKISRPARMMDPAMIAEREAIVHELQSVLKWIESKKDEVEPLDYTHGLKMSWSLEAGEMWDVFYNGLGDDDAEYLTRAEVFVMRLSMIYALLDKAAVMQPVHLKAALAVWAYAKQSAKLIFGNPQSPNAIKLMERTLAAGYVKRGAVHELFQRHMGSEALDWVMEEAARLSGGRLEVDYGVFKGEQIVKSVHLVGKT